MGAPVACLHGQGFLEFANAVTGAPDAHQDRAQGAVSLLQGWRKTNHLLELCARGIEIVAGESSHSGLISSVSLRRGLLRMASIGRGQQEGEDATSKQPRFKSIR